MVKTTKFEEKNILNIPWLMVTYPLKLYVWVMVIKTFLPPFNRHIFQQLERLVLLCKMCGNTIHTRCLTKMILLMVTKRHHEFIYMNTFAPKHFTIQKCKNVKTSVFLILQKHVAQVSS